MGLIKQAKNRYLGVNIQGIEPLLSVNIDTLGIQCLPLFNQVASICAVSLYRTTGVKAIRLSIPWQKMPAAAAHNHIDTIDISALKSRLEVAFKVN